MNIPAIPAILGFTMVPWWGDEALRAESGCAGHWSGRCLAWSQHWAWRTELGLEDLAWQSSEDALESGRWFWSVSWVSCVHNFAFIFGVALCMLFFLSTPIEHSSFCISSSFPFCTTSRRLLLCMGQGWGVEYECLPSNQALPTVGWEDGEMDPVAGEGATWERSQWHQRALADAENVGWPKRASRMGQFQGFVCCAVISENVKCPLTLVLWWEWCLMMGMMGMMEAIPTDEDVPWCRPNFRHPRCWLSLSSWSPRARLSRAPGVVHKTTLPGFGPSPPCPTRPRNPAWTKGFGASWSRTWMPGSTWMHLVTGIPEDSTFLPKIGG